MGVIAWTTWVRGRGQLIGWGVAVFLWALLVMSLYDTVAANQQMFQQLLAAYPPQFEAFFGDLGAFATVEGFLSLEFFSFMPLLLGVFAVLGGSWLLAGDEERGLLELYLSNPISRLSFFAGRVVGLVALILALLGIGFLGLAIPMGPSSLDLPLLHLARPFVSLFALLSVYSALGLFLSQALPSGRMAAMGSGLALIAGYLFTVLGRLSEDSETASRFTPFAYYQTGEALSGLNWTWVGGLLAVALGLTIMAGVLFQRRDLRVAGEGSLGAVSPAAPA
ncbi:MAG: ABC transporter permease subunit [Anaerolineales bacterium]